MPASDDRYSAYNARQPEDGPGPMGYLALVMAWAVPGLGHWMIGEKARGIVVGATIHLLFAGGLLIGGIRAINPPDQPIWTYTQFLTGWPMILANQLEHRARAEWVDLFKQYDDELNKSDGAARLKEPPEETTEQNVARKQKLAEDFIAAHPLFAYHPKVQDMGAVYCGIAGMLNLLAMFDVVLRITGSVREDPTALRRQQRAARAAQAAGAREGGQ